MTDERIHPGDIVRYRARHAGGVEYRGVVLTAKGRALTVRPDHKPGPQFVDLDHCSSVTKETQ